MNDFSSSPSSPSSSPSSPSSSPSSPDGLNFEPRAIEPESALTPGMAAPASPGSRKEAFGPTPLAMPPTGGPGPTALQEPGTWTYDFNPATGSSRATFTGEVIATSIAAPGSGVASFNTRTGAVVLTAADVTGVGGLTNPSPGLTGSPTAPTAAPGTSTTQIATTAFVAQAIVANPIVQSFNGRTGAVTLTAGDVTNAGGAPVSSPAFTGSPTTPTPMQGDQSGKIASTQFVANAIASGTVTSWNGRQGGVTMTLSDVTSVGGAPINSPNFTGVPSGTTAAPGTATTQLATTAFVTNAVTAGAAGVASFNTRTGAVTLQLADVTSVGGAPLLSPAFTGTPTAPTPTAGDSSTKLATTAFVGTAIASLPSGVTTFNGRSGTVTLQLTDVTSVGGAPLASPTFSGTPKSVTPAPGDNSINIATTAFVAASFAPITSVPTASAATPLMDGTAAAGNATAWSRGDHVHPTDTSRYAATNPAGYQTAAQVTTSLAGYLPLTGGNLTGTLNSSAQIGATNIIACNATGTGNSAVQLYDSVPALRSQYYYSGSSGGIAITHQNSGAYWFLDSAGNCIANPSTGSNFQVTNGGHGYQAGGGSWIALSDARIKNVHGDYESGLAEICALHPVNYSYKGNDMEADGSSLHAAVAGKTFVGLVAQDAETVMPEMVTRHQGYIDDEKVNDLRKLDTGPLIFALVNAVQELTMRLEALETDKRTPRSSEKRLIFTLVNSVQELTMRLEALETDKRAPRPSEKRAPR